MDTELAENLYHQDPDILSAILDRFNDTVAGYEMELIFPKIKCPTLLLQADPTTGGLMTNEEVQQALLPRIAPEIQGLDIASRSVYCDETGGDYYDFITGAEHDAGVLSVVVGDVAGHGISSALLMDSPAASGTLSLISSSRDRWLRIAEATVSRDVATFPACSAFEIARFRFFS